MRKKVLFISYKFSGFGVGLQRVKYWLNNMLEVSGNSIECDLLTESEPVDVSESVARVIVVPNSKKGGILGSFIKDEGVAWKYDVQRELKRRKRLAYDVVIMSGNPFMHFALAEFLKQRFKAKVILDFRDPFANNPRHAPGNLKLMAKSFFEGYFIKSADHVITVNQTCADLMHFSDFPEVGSSIIPNGYDDQSIDVILEGSRNREPNPDIQLIYLGSYYPDTNPNIIYEVLSEDAYQSKLSIKYIGANADLLEEFKSKENIIISPPLTYTKAMEGLCRADVGVIHTGGQPFESTTKIFDYIGLEKAILIITEGEERSGELHEITRDYPKVFWCRNTESSIKTILDRLLNEELNFVNPSRQLHSRKTGLKKLIDIILNTD